MLQMHSKKKVFIAACIVLTNTVFSQKLQLNDLEYFETRGLNVIVF